MANIKSQIKRNKQNQAKRQQNRVYRSSARTYVRKALAAMKTENSEDANKEVSNAIKALDKAASKGVVHKNNAARRKSRLMKKFNALGK